MATFDRISSMESSTQTFSELFKNSFGVVHQCDETSLLWLDFQGKKTPLRYLGFLSIKRRVDQVDVLSMFEDTTKGGDLEVINVRGCERCFVVNIQELIGLKELLNGAKVMLDLNSIVHERLYNVLI